MSINAPSYHQSRLGYGQAGANMYNSGYGVNSAVSPPPISINRFPGFPAAAPGTSVFPQATDSLDLRKYRVAPGNLMDAKTGKDLQPDQNGVYTRLNADGSKNYFIRMANGDIYQVGNFDPRTMTWQVLDAQTGQAIGILDRPGKKGNRWLAINKLPSQETQPPQAERGGRAQRGGGAQAGGGGRRGGAQGGGGAEAGREAQPGQPNSRESTRDGAGLFEKLKDAFYAAKGKIEGALDNIDKPWDSKTARVMDKLFGHTIFTQEGRNALKSKLEGTYRALMSTIRNGFRNVRVGATSPGTAAQAFPASGSMIFNPNAIRNVSLEKQSEIVSHELSHLIGTNDDSGYLTASNDRRPNLHGNLARNTFQNNVNNADHVARAATTLSANQSRPEAFV